MNTDYETKIPVSAIDEDQLTQLIGNLSRVTGQPIQIKKLYVLCTPSTAAAILLDALRDSIKAERLNGKTAAAMAAKVVKHRKARPARPRQAEGELGSRSWRHVDTGTIYSALALQKLVGEGKIPLEARFVNAKGEYQVVLPGEEGHRALIKEPKS